MSREAFSYLFMNYRGYGSMRDVRGAYTIDEIATDALALADELGFQTFSMIGHSMGGMAMERIATFAPERVRAMVAVAPVPCGGISYCWVQARPQVRMPSPLLADVQGLGSRLFLGVFEPPVSNQVPIVAQ